MLKDAFTRMLTSSSPFLLPANLGGKPREEGALSELLNTELAEILR